MELPPEQRRTTGLLTVGGIMERSAPRVHISTSVYSTSGRMLRSIRSSPVAGP
jgi:hypothetical protein